MSDYRLTTDEKGRSVVERTIHHPCGATKTARYVYEGDAGPGILYTLVGIGLGLGLFWSVIVGVLWMVTQ